MLKEICVNSFFFSSSALLHMYKFFSIALNKFFSPVSYPEAGIGFQLLLGKCPSRGKVPEAERLAPRDWEIPAPVYNCTIYGQV